MSSIKRNGIFFHMVIRFPIYMNLTSKTENLVYTRCGITEIFKKSGLVDEALGKLLDLTRLYLYH